MKYSRILLFLIYSINVNNFAKNKPLLKPNSNSAEICSLEKEIQIKKTELKKLEEKLEKLKNQKPQKETKKTKKVFYDLGSGTGKVAVHAYLYDPQKPKNAIDFIEKNYKDVRGEIAESERQMITKGKGSPVYGEILPESFEKILKLPELNINGFDRVIGIELSPTRNFHATTVAKKIKELPGKSLKFLNENIAEADFSDADVIYMCSTCYPNDLMQILLEKFGELKKGTIIISLKSLPEGYADYGFKLIKEITLPMTWSSEKGGSPVYIYKLENK